MVHEIPPAAGADETAATRKTRRRARRWLGVTVSVLGLCSGFLWWANRRVANAARGGLCDHPGCAGKAQAAIVPGARVYPDGTPSPALEDRLRAALELYRAGNVRRILVSGDHGAAAYDEPNAMRRWLLARGVSSSDVFLDHAGFRTLDTMQRAAQVFRIETAIVCTQEFHLPRALYLAAHAGIRAVGYRADRRRYASARRDQVREVFARALAVVDAEVLARRARYLGPTIPIDGDATRTHDRATTP